MALRDIGCTTDPALLESQIEVERLKHAAGSAGDFGTDSVTGEQRDQRHSFSFAWNGAVPALIRTD